MLPGRYGGGQPPVSRKSRLESKSMLPKPVRPGSIDRLSTDRRPSNAGPRSSSAEPPRVTFGGGRMSKDTSAHKGPMNRRSKSQQGDRGVSMTPLHSNRPRPTTTPVRTPTDDRVRSWQTCLERVLAFVTIKDQRPISTVAWQRAEMSRVQESLMGRRECVSGGGGMVLVRPLTIARFVDIADALLAAIIRDAKLNSDNYVTKLPHLAKRLLYPGTISKSWLKTVNTLHAFPHALGLISYLLDIVQHLEMPVSDEWMYADKDQLSCLRRDYLQKCWIRFQVPGHEFDDLNNEYLLNMRQIMEYDEEKVDLLRQTIKHLSASLEDEAESETARGELSRRVERRDALLAAIRAERHAARTVRADIHAERALLVDHAEERRTIDVEIDRLKVESEQLEHELENQSMSVTQRTRLLEEVDYVRKVEQSKRALIHQISEMAQSKETELAQWQKKTLDSCVDYNKGLIHLSAQFPDLAPLTLDQKELMEPQCVDTVSRAADMLRALANKLGERRAEQVRARTALANKRAQELEVLRAKVSDLKMSIQREQHTLEAARTHEATEAAAFSAFQQSMADRVQEFRADGERLARLQAEATQLEARHDQWVAKLSEMQEYISQQEAEMPRMLEREKERRTKLVSSATRQWTAKISQM